MPSSADPHPPSIDSALQRAVEEVLGALASSRAPAGAAPIVLIDGRSGSGKSTLAAMLAERWTGEVQIVALDDVYPGWDGLRQGSEVIRESVLTPHGAGEPAHWRRWDWGADRYDRADSAAPGTALIVEGSGVLTAASAPLATVSVWLESPEKSRRDRALERDGDAYRPHWERWAAQEQAHLDRDAPRDRATIVIDVP